MSGNYQRLDDSLEGRLSTGRLSTGQARHPSVKYNTELQAHRIKRRIRKTQFQDQDIVAPTFIRDDLVDAKKAKLQHQRLLQWRDYDLIALLFAAIGFVLATIDYEINFYPLRSKAGDDPTEMAKILVSFTTILCLVFICWRHQLKRNWLNQSLPYKHKFCTLGFTLEIGFILIQPIPYLRTSFILQTLDTQTSDKNTYTYPQYYVNQILYALMIGRLILIIRNHFNYSIYNDSNAKKVCAHYGFSGNMRFSLKAMLLKHPGWTAIIIMGSTILVLTFLLRVLERPFCYVMEPRSDQFDNFYNALWCLVITMTTVGYGDIVPVTFPGKMVAMIACLWGAFVISLAVVVLSNVLSLPQEQKYAVYQIALLRRAKRVIKSTFQLSRAKNDSILNPYVKHEMLQKKYVRHYNIVTDFLKGKEQLKSSNIFGEESGSAPLSRMDVEIMMKEKIDTLRGEMQDFIKKENQEMLQQLERILLREPSFIRDKPDTFIHKESMQL